MLKRLLMMFVFFAVAVSALDAFAAPPTRVGSAPRPLGVEMGDAGAASQQMPMVEAAASAAPNPLGAVQEYVLGIGDRVKLTVYGEADLSGEYEVGSTGIIALPLIGSVDAAGRPLRQFEEAVRSKLAQGYLRDPRVSAQVVNYRPFFILGEVAKPGSYPYVNGMTVINAIAMAGGYTYRADKGDIQIKRASDTASGEVRVREEEIVMPGDVLRVPQRFF